MRLAIYGLVAAMAALSAGCSGPAVGSKEWCNGVMNRSIVPNQQDAAQMQAAIQCVMGAAGDAMKNMPTLPGQ